MKNKPKPSTGLEHQTNEKRKVSMFKRASNFAKVVLNPFVGMKSNPCGTGKR